MSLSNSIQEIPMFLRELRDPWLVGVPYELASKIRFNSTIDMTFNGRAIILDYTSGGDGTVISRLADEKTLSDLKEFMKNEYFSNEKDPKSLLELADFLKKRKVKISDSSAFEVNAIECKPGKEVVLATKNIIDLLPESHTGHKYFNELRLGGWGKGDSKCSEHYENRVHMFTFTVNGARRNYYPLLLHEIGHSIFNLIKEEQPALGKAILQESKNENIQSIKPLLVDYLFGESSRFHIISKEPAEFAAEMYMLYVVRGATLKDLSFCFPENKCKTVNRIYNIYKEVFKGKEYI